MPAFHIFGRVIDHGTSQALPRLRVEVWDKDLICDDLVGSTVTDEQGVFQLNFDESRFQELFKDRRPDLFFKVFQEGELIESTEDSVLWNVAAGDTQIIIPTQLKKEGITMPDCSQIEALIRAKQEQINLLEEIGCEPGQAGAGCRARLTALRRELERLQAALRSCQAGLPPPGIQETRGRVTFLRINDSGGFGPPTDFLDAEVIFILDTQPGRAFGFQLRNDNERPAREGMLSLLRESLVNRLNLIIDYRQELQKFNSIAFRIALLEREELIPPIFQR